MDCNSIAEKGCHPHSRLFWNKLRTLVSEQKGEKSVISLFFAEDDVLMTTSGPHVLIYEY